MSKKVIRRDLNIAWKKWRSRGPFLLPCSDMNFFDALKRKRFTDRQQRIHISIDVGYLSDEQNSYIKTQAEELQEQFIESQGRMVYA